MARLIRTRKQCEQDGVRPASNWTPGGLGWTVNWTKKILKCEGERIIMNAVPIPLDVIENFTPVVLGSNEQEFPLELRDLDRKVYRLCATFQWKNKSSKPRELKRNYATILFRVRFKRRFPAHGTGWLFSVQMVTSTSCRRCRISPHPLKESNRFHLIGNRIPNH